MNPDNTSITPGNTDINYAPKLLNGLETLWKDRTFIGESAQGRP